MRGPLACLALLAVASLAHAGPPKLAALTKQYADKHGLPVRIVKNDLGTRQVERHFVPVLPTTHDDFLATFSIGNGAVTWRTGADAVHVQLSVAPGNVIAWGANRGKGAVAQHGEQGFYMALALDAPELAHWEQLIDKYTPANQAVANGRDHYRDPKANQCYGSCMWWMVHAEISQNLNLSTAMGVRRAKGPEILAPRLIHAGNELVGPIGIRVANVAQFNAMTDQQLLGPEPAGGAAEQVKE